MLQKSFHHSNPFGLMAAIALVVLLACGYLLEYPKASPAVICVYGGILWFRRSDWKGGMLFLALLSLLATLAFLLGNGLSRLFPGLGSSFPAVVVTLVVFKEFQRFLDNEFGEGIRIRRHGITLGCLLIAFLQAYWLWCF